MKDYALGKKCLPPSIFRKSKGPIILSTSSQYLNVSGPLETSLKGINNGAKRSEALGIIKDASL